MTFPRLLLRNLIFHWRANLAVLLGVAVGTAVLTGALLVGDSLRGSLRERALEQLGWVDEALVAGRFFREELGKHLPAGKVSPAILLQGSASTPQAQAGRVTVLAVDDRFWPAEQIPVDAAFWRSGQEGVVLNQLVARRLGVRVGDPITLHLQSADSVPRETLLGKRKSEDVLSRFTLTVRAILPEHGLGAFTLRPGPAPPANVFVPLRLLQDKYDPETKKALLAGRVNALFVSGATGSLPEALRRDQALADWNLELRTPDDRARDWFNLLAGRGSNAAPDDFKLREFRWKGRVPEALAAKAVDKALSVEDFIAYVRAAHRHLSLESSQMFVDDVALAAAERAADRLGWRTAATLVYLVDTVSADGRESAYVVVAGIPPRGEAPLGPIGPEPLVNNHIYLVDWPGSPFSPKEWVASPDKNLQRPLKAVILRYYRPDEAGQLRLSTLKMPVGGWVPLEGAADDGDLTPRFEGITDKLDVREWNNPPFPFEPKRVTEADENFWKRYRATPKAYVTLSTGQALWGSRFGRVTSVRLASPYRVGFDKQAADYRQALLQELPPEQGRLAFQDVRAQALAAGQGSSDFGTLFLGFSCFLIAAALLLVGLLVRLGLDQRAREMGLLLAVGWRRGQVRWLLLAEGLVLGLVGAVLGVAGALAYADLLLQLLSVLWPGGLERSLLRLHVDLLNCVIGYLSSVAVAVVTIFLATRLLARVPPRALLAGETIPAGPSGQPRRARLSAWIAGLALVGALACLVTGEVVSDHEAQAGSFFGSGMLLLMALLAGLWWWMRRAGHTHAATMPGLLRLGVRNAARHPVRSVLTVGLLASASFLIVAVQAFHRDPGRDFLNKDGGSGGFAWVAESTVPIFQDLATPAGRSAVGVPPDPLWQGAAVLSFRVQPGDDVSCLNLYQPGQPRVLGVPQRLIDRGGFRFSAHEGEAANPWQLLTGQRSDGAIPAIGEANAVKYILHSDIGQEITVRDDFGRPVRLRIVALLQDSVFQSELLVSDRNFLRLFPRQEGFQFFLIDTPRLGGPAARQTLETALADHGFSMTPSAERLQSYLDVENTYLATFQALGGLGLLLGTLGLAVVLVRSVWERRGELALLRALGFRRSALGWLVLAENAWLLLLGLGFGCTAAVVCVAPYLVAQTGTVVSVPMLGLLLLVVVLGLAAGAAAVALTLRAPLLPALRRE